MQNTLPSCVGLVCGLLVVFAAAEENKVRFPQQPGYEFLGEGYCFDDLYRPLSSMVAVVKGDLLTIVEECIKFCESAKLKLDLCMGIEVRQKYNNTDGFGFCHLLDRDWKNTDRFNARDTLGVEVDADRIYEGFPGIHITHVEDDSEMRKRNLHSLLDNVGCYRRVVQCDLAPDCAALNRYACDRGKTPQSCDLCLPRYVNPAGRSVGNTVCTSDGAESPTLRIALGSASFVWDVGGKDEGLNSAMLGTLFAMKYLWQTNNANIPIPMAERQQFDIEISGFTENVMRLSTTKEVNGTGQVSPFSVESGLRAISGARNGKFKKDMQLRESSHRPHVVFGGYVEKEQTANIKKKYGSIESESTLATVGEVFQTPIIGFGFIDRRFTDYPYYIRTNRVALDPAKAIAKLLKHLGYTRIFVVEQAEGEDLGKKIEQEMPTAMVHINVTGTGACEGEEQCTERLLDTWSHLRQLDARIIVYAFGSESEWEFLAMLDFFDDKTLLIQTGFPCDWDLWPFYWMQANKADKKIKSLSTCKVCQNVAFSGMSMEQLANSDIGGIAEWIFGEENPKAADWPNQCPSIPDKTALLNCEYCHASNSYWLSPGCDLVNERFNKRLRNSFCVSSDTSTDEDLKSMWQQHVQCPSCPWSNQTWNKLFSNIGNENLRAEMSMNAVKSLHAVGMPWSYLESYVPRPADCATSPQGTCGANAGKTYQRGLESSIQKPVTYYYRWGTRQILDELEPRLEAWEDKEALDSWIDGMLTVIVAFNEFVKKGGDADVTSDPTSTAYNLVHGNNAASGWKRFLLNANFPGITNTVQYLKSGERDVTYTIHRLKDSTGHGTCDLSFSSNNMTIDGTKQAWRTSSWNLISAPDSTNLRAPLAHDPANELGCAPFESNFAGKFLLVRRGVCRFGLKALNAQAADAVALVVFDNVPEPLHGEMWAQSRRIKIPGVKIGQNGGLNLWEALEAGSHIEVKIEGSTRCLSSSLFNTGYEQKPQPVFSFEAQALYDVGKDELILESDLRFADGTATQPDQQGGGCGPGQYSSMMERECVACPLGRYQYGLSGNNSLYECQECLPGTFANLEGSTECVPCSKGSVSPQSGATNCEPCKPGQYSNSKASRCIDCPVGRLPTLDATACKKCIAGRSTQIRDCSRERDNPDCLEITTCVDCSAGSFQPEEGGFGCIKCQAGRFQPSTRAFADCEKCPFLYDSPEGADDCVLNWDVLIPYLIIAVIILAACLTLVFWRFRRRLLISRHKSRLANLSQVADPVLQQQIGEMHWHLWVSILRNAQKAAMNDEDPNLHGELMRDLDSRFYELQQKANEAAKKESHYLAEMAQLYIYDHNKTKKRWELLLKIPTQRKNDVLNCQSSHVDQWYAVDTEGNVVFKPTDNHLYLNFISKHAEWLHEKFVSDIIAIARFVNEAKKVANVCQKYQLQDANFPFTFEDQFYPLIDDKKAQLNGRRVQVKAGNVKAPESAQRKVDGMASWLSDETNGQPQSPFARYVTDFLRLTIVCEDPFVLALMFDAVGAKFEMPRQDNKHLKLEDPNFHGSPAILTNVVIEGFDYGIDSLNAHTAEVQFMLQGFVNLKKNQHQTYEVTRAKHWTELTSPILPYRGRSRISGLDLVVDNLPHTKSYEFSGSSPLGSPGGAPGGSPKDSPGGSFPFVHQGSPGPSNPMQLGEEAQRGPNPPETIRKPSVNL